MLNHVLCTINIALTFIITIAICDDYCSLNCSDLHGNLIKHTVCERQPPCSPAPACGTKPRPLQTNNEMRAWFLKRHNQYRSRVAKGGVRFKGGVFKAGNMQKLQWDEELEYTARCWVNACDVGKDLCRITERFNVAVGQNRFDRIVGEDDGTDERAEIYRAIDHWYNEARFLNETLIKRYNGTVASQATQLLWARTTHIGCAGIEYYVEEERIRTTICNYGPGGNIPGSSIFLIGEPCSKCGQKMCCDEEFDGLCTAKSTSNNIIKQIFIFPVFFMTVVLIK